MLLTGAILTPGRRSVTSVPRITGLARERRFVNYHHVLNPAAWYLQAAACLLLGLLVAAFAPSTPVVLGIFAALELLAALSRRRVACVTRLQLGAALCDPAPLRLAGTVGRPRTRADAWRICPRG